MTREFLMSNFTHIYEVHQSIPIGILLEPLLKQIQVSEGITYIYNIFDFAFFVTMANHPKMQLKHAIQLIDILAKIYLNDPNFSSAASSPFMLLASKFSEQEQVKDFLMKFLTIALSMLLTVEKVKDSRSEKKKKMDAVKKKYGKKGTKEEELKEYQQEMDEANRALKKTFIIEVARKIQNLRIEEVNDQMRSMLLSTNRRNKELFN